MKLKSPSCWGQAIGQGGQLVVAETGARSPQCWASGCGHGNEMRAQAEGAGVGAAEAAWGEGEEV